jgi:hypothetical protein
MRPFVAVDFMRKAPGRPKLFSLIKHLEISLAKFPSDYNQYTRVYSPSHTTSTKCQYQAAPSKPK